MNIDVLKILDKVSNKYKAPSIVNVSLEISFKETLNYHQEAHGFATFRKSKKSMILKNLIVIIEEKGRLVCVFSRAEQNRRNLSCRFRLMSKVSFI